jgi:hypothetical protein
MEKGVELVIGIQIVKFKSLEKGVVLNMVD